jgi:hypothetical protein
MRHKDRLDGHAQLFNGVQDHRRLLAGIHDQRALRTVAP